MRAPRPIIPKTLHPKMVAHGLKVKAAHAHLARTVPQFNQMPAPQRMKAIQQHIRNAR